MLVLNLVSTCCPSFPISFPHTPWSKNGIQHKNTFNTGARGKIKGKKPVEEPNTWQSVLPSSQNLKANRSWSIHFAFLVKQSTTITSVSLSNTLGIYPVVVKSFAASQTYFIDVATSASNVQDCTSLCGFRIPGIHVAGRNFVCIDPWQLIMFAIATGWFCWAWTKTLLSFNGRWRHPFQAFAWLSKKMLHAASPCALGRPLGHVSCHRVSLSEEERTLRRLARSSNARVFPKQNQNSSRVTEIPTLINSKKNEFLTGVQGIWSVLRSWGSDLTCWFWKHKIVMIIK